MKKLLLAFISCGALLLFCASSVQAASDRDACYTTCSTSYPGTDSASVASYNSCINGCDAAYPNSTTTSTSSSEAAVTLFNPLGSITDPRQVIGNLIAGVLTIIGSVTLLMFVYGGVLWITAMGDPKKVQKGKDILIWGIMGLVLIAGSYTLVQAIIKGLTTGNAGT